MDTEKLYKELTVFCKNKGLEERKAAYLLGLFTNYAEALRQPLVSGRSEQFVCGANRVMGEKRCERQCGQCEELYPQTNCH